MENLIIHSKYNNPISRDLINGIAKNGVWLTTKESIIIANKIDELENMKSTMFEERGTQLKFARSIVKLLRELKNGRGLNDLLQDYGILLEENEYNYIINMPINSDQGTYFKTKITETKTSETSKSTRYVREEYDAATNQKIEQ